MLRQPVTENPPCPQRARERQGKKHRESQLCALGPYTFFSFLKKKNILIEIYFTYLTTYPFKVYNSTVLVHSQLCKHYHNLRLEHFVTSKRNPYPCAVTPHFPPPPPKLSPPSLETTHLLSDRMDF